MNVCKFIKFSNSSGEINIINFVHETERFGNAVPYTLYCFRLCLVTDGSGTILSSGKEEHVSRGDVFFTFPKISFTIEGDKQFEYMYISYSGERATNINKQLAISPERFVFKGHEHLITLWTHGINTQNNLAGYAAEGILLYTLSHLGSIAEEHSSPLPSASTKRLYQVKNHIDNNFFDCELSLETLSEQFFYNKKFLSTAFKRQFGTGIKEYITNLRINRSLYLIEQNYTMIKIIASMCGFKDQLYFSKVFKKNIGMTPKEYIKTNMNIVYEENKNG